MRKREMNSSLCVYMKKCSGEMLYDYIGFSVNPVMITSGLPIYYYCKIGSAAAPKKLEVGSDPDPKHFRVSGRTREYRDLEPNPSGSGRTRVSTWELVLDCWFARYVSRVVTQQRS